LTKNDLFSGRRWPRRQLVVFDKLTDNESKKATNRNKNLNLVQIFFFFFVFIIHFKATATEDPRRKSFCLFEQFCFSFEWDNFMSIFFPELYFTKLDFWQTRWGFISVTLWIFKSFWQLNVGCEDRYCISFENYLMWHFQLILSNLWLDFFGVQSLQFLQSLLF
jgi:hypothetical protein